MDTLNYILQMGNLKYYLLGTIVILAIAITLVVKRRRAEKKLMKKIIDQWGKPPSGKYSEEDMPNIRSYFDNLISSVKNSPGDVPQTKNTETIPLVAEKNKGHSLDVDMQHNTVDTDTPQSVADHGCIGAVNKSTDSGEKEGCCSEDKRHFLDDITWSDLDMDNVFKTLNCTHSTAGEEFLYALLREPVSDSNRLKERNRLADFFRNNPDQRRKIQFILTRLGKSRFSGLSNYFFSKSKYKPFRRNKYLLQIALFFIATLLSAINPPLGVLLIFTSAFLNMATYNKAKIELAAQLDGLSHMVNLINYSKKIADCGFPELETYSINIRKSLTRFKSAGFKSFYQIFYKTNDPILEYLKSIFLIELVAFEGISKKISRHRQELRLLFEIVGLLDSMITVASFRERLAFYTVPVLYKSNENRKPSIQFDDIYHPLIDKPVTNSAKLEKSTLVTGSNASGKSTFLKTVAINGIFAQTIGTCLASAYTSSYFAIYTSMAIRDNLLSKESYYIAEVKSLKRILDELNDGYPLLCVIDEILKGTNTIERIAASSGALHYLSVRNCICLAATHDTELVSILGTLCDNYHFSEQFDDNNIVFDYRIRPGKSRTRNAIKLLSIMGYPESIVSEASHRAEIFGQEGSWLSVDINLPI